MSNLSDSPERNAPDPILPEPIGEDGLVQPREPDEAPGQGNGQGHDQNKGQGKVRSGSTPELPDRPVEG
ncbi:hypothetical protein [Aureimonas sp. AU20]|uniref:hypothetical protein n=1 Tax=Aureimonas sp. AU20 TaxID=1349819 RepID=UPI000721D005|nr:hypothetical protein [Aureimonas sp. AU20]ALN71787.1 hypothetical protein M673_03620 [Aureimonas sp. AU20]